MKTTYQTTVFPSRREPLVDSQELNTKPDPILKWCLWAIIIIPAAGAIAYLFSIR